MSSPLISLVIPAYNAGRYISQAIASVKEQTLDSKEFQTIIVNDGSADNTREIIESEIEGMSNTLIISYKSNKGQPYARNLGISNASGRFVALLDSDDELEPTALEETLQFMESNPEVKYSYSKMRKIDSDGKSIGEAPSHPFSSENLLHFNFVSHIRCFTPELHSEIGGYDSKVPYGQDWDHVLRASEVLPEEGIRRHNKVLYRYRVHPGSISKTKNGERSEMVICAIERSLGRRGIVAEVFFSHKTDDGYSYYDWRTK